MEESSPLLQKIIRSVKMTYLLRCPQAVKYTYIVDISRLAIKKINMYIVNTILSILYNDVENLEILVILLAA